MDVPIGITSWKEQRRVLSQALKSFRTDRQEGQGKGVLEWNDRSRSITGAYEEKYVFFERINQRMTWLVCGVEMR